MVKTKCDAVKRCDHILVYGSFTTGNAVKRFNCILLNVFRVQSSELNSECCKEV